MRRVCCNKELRVVIQEVCYEPNEYLLHLWMEVCLRFFNEEHVDRGSVLFIGSALLEGEDLQNSVGES